MQMFPFSTLPKGPFAFQPVLDGSTYKANVTWNIFGQRWYLTLSDQSGNVIVHTAIVESPPFFSITSLSWDGERQLVTIETVAPHNLPLGAVIDLTLREASPDVFNGKWEMTVASPTSLTFEMATDPGQPVLLGNFGRDIDLTAGYFSTSVLVYRNETFFAYP